MPPTPLPRSILLALGLAACDDKAGDSAEVRADVCLSVIPHDTDTGPCLEPYVGDTDDSGDTGDSADTGDSGDTGDTGEVSPCLAPKEDYRADPGASGGIPRARPAVASAVEAARKVLERGVLPPDVAALVRERGPLR